MTQVDWIVDNDSKYAAVVILDEESGERLEIQRALGFDDQDVELGMDTYCLVRGGAAHYGGVAGYEVAEKSVEFRLEETAAQALELPRVFAISLDADGAALLREHLPALLTS